MDEVAIPEASLVPSMPSWLAPLLLLFLREEGGVGGRVGPEDRNFRFRGDMFGGVVLGSGLDGEGGHDALRA